MASLSIVCVLILYSPWLQKPLDIRNPYTVGFTGAQQLLAFIVDHTRKSPYQKLSRSFVCTRQWAQIEPMIFRIPSIPLLPIELRLAIWKLAIPQNRITAQIRLVRKVPECPTKEGSILRVSQVPPRRHVSACQQRRKSKIRGKNKRP